METAKRIFGFFYEIIETATFSLTLVFATYLFLFQVGEVHGTSSYPTWQENERFITDKISYKLHSPERGDFVVIQSPRNPEIDFIKRIIGLPNETIKIAGCQVYIDKQLLAEPYLQPNTCTNRDQEKLIPSDSYFVMGYNRQNSSDSRDFGPISASSIVGKVIFRFWPMEKLGPKF